MARIHPDPRGGAVAPKLLTLPCMTAQRPRLLIVDDEPSIRFAMREFFLADFDVDCASDADEGEALIDRTEYAAIVVDLRLTGSEQLEGMRVIRTARKRCALVKIVVLSAYSSPELDAEARGNGADLIIRKPRPLSEIACDLFRLIGIGKRPPIQAPS